MRRTHVWSDENPQTKAEQLLHPLSWLHTRFGPERKEVTHQTVLNKQNQCVVLGTGWPNMFSMSYKAPIIKNHFRGDWTSGRSFRLCCLIKKYLPFSLPPLFLSLNTFFFTKVIYFSSLMKYYLWQQYSNASYTCGTLSCCSHRFKAWQLLMCLCTYLTYVVIQVNPQLLYYFGQNISIISILVL